MKDNNQKRNWLLWLLPSPGNIIVTLLIVSALHWGQSADAITHGASGSPATSYIPSQGVLADVDGHRLSGQEEMTFNLYTESAGGEPVWTEGRTGENSVEITDGVYNIMLGSVNALDQSIIAENSTLYLGVTVGVYEEMTPRVQIGRVPYAVQALTVPDGSITRAKLASDAVENSGDSAVEHYIAQADQDIWDLPDCTLGEHGEDGSWTTIPGASIDFTLNVSKTVWLDFAGLGTNQGVGQAIYSNIFVDGKRTQLPSGASDLSGCRNNRQGGLSDSWCTLSNLAGPLLGPGEHTIEAKAWCDGDDGLARVYGGTLRALVLP